MNKHFMSLGFIILIILAGVFCFSPAKASAKELVAFGYSTNSWESDGWHTQLSLNLSNESEQELAGWELVLKLPAGTKVEQSWNAIVKKSGNELKIKPAEYNRQIIPGGSVDLGLILSAKKEIILKVKGIWLNGQKLTKGQYWVQNESEFPPTDQNQPDTSDSDAQEKQDPDSDSSNVNQPVADDSNTNDSSSEKLTTDSPSSKDSQNWPSDPVYKNGKTPYQQHGRLRVKGTKLVDKKGKVFVLKGVSTHGLFWFPQYVNQSAFRSLRDNFHVNAIRLALYSNPADGYSEQMHQKVMEGVDACTKLGMYCIIDWHILNDNNPNTVQNRRNALRFFTQMAKRYKNQGNVIYEICNEPNGDVTWERDIRPYATWLVGKIRKIDENAIIIVGTPTWSQDVDVVSTYPLTQKKNIMYALHFYASTHKQELQNKLRIAISNGLPVLISEFSICDASGNGSIDFASAKEWFRLIRKKQLSCFAWSLCNKNESASLLLPSCQKTGNFTKQDLSTTGKWILGQYLK